MNLSPFYVQEYTTHIGNSKDGKHQYFKREIGQGKRISRTYYKVSDAGTGRSGDAFSNSRSTYLIRKAVEIPYEEFRKVQLQLVKPKIQKARILQVA